MMMRMNGSIWLRKESQNNSSIVIKYLLWKTVVFCESNGWQKVNGKWINPNQNKQTNHYWSIKSMTIIINFILLPMNELVGQNDNNYVAWPRQNGKIKQCRCSIILIKLSHHAQHIHLHKLFFQWKVCNQFVIGWL